MGETSKKVTAGPVANSKRVKASTAADKLAKTPAKKATAKKPAQPKKAKEITETKPKGVVQAPKSLEKVVNAPKESLWSKLKKALGL